LKLLDVSYKLKLAIIPYSLQLRVFSAVMTLYLTIASLETIYHNSRKKGLKDVNSQMWGRKVWIL